MAAVRGLAAAQAEGGGGVRMRLPVAQQPRSCLFPDSFKVARPVHTLTHAHDDRRPHHERHVNDTSQPKSTLKMATLQLG